MYYQLTVHEPFTDISGYGKEVSADWWLQNVSIPLAPFFRIFEWVTEPSNPPDAYTRRNMYDRLLRQIEDMCNDVMLSDGRPVCDETNNTQRHVDTENIVADVF